MCELESAASGAGVPEREEQVSGGVQRKGLGADAWRNACFGKGSGDRARVVAGEAKVIGKGFALLGE